MPSPPTASASPSSTPSSTTASSDRCSPPTGPPRRPRSAPPWPPSTTPSAATSPAHDSERQHETRHNVTEPHHQEVLADVPVPSRVAATQPTAYCIQAPSYPGPRLHPGPPAGPLSAPGSQAWST